MEIRSKLEPPTHEGCQRRRDVALRARRRQCEFRILAQDCPLELLQLGPRLDSELFDEDPAGPPVGIERFGLASRAVEREHVLAS